MKSVGASAIAIVLGMASTCALATTGGPQLAEVLGWDPVDQKAYVAIHYQDEGWGLDIVYFDLRKPSREKAIVVRAANRESLLTALRRRLRPLRPRPTESFPSQILSVTEDSLVDARGWPLKRFRQRAILENSFMDSVEVVSYEKPSVYGGFRMLASFDIPGQPYRLAIISMKAIPTDGLYEAQVPVILGGPGIHKVDSRYPRW